MMTKKNRKDGLGALGYGDYGASYVLSTELPLEHSFDQRRPWE